MDSETKKPTTSNELRDYRIGKLEDSQKEMLLRLGGLELWKAKVEDIIKGKNADNPPTPDSPSSKDWIKILIMALTIISALVALLAQVAK